MSDITATKELLAGQYRNASNLNARAYLHEQFSTNPYGWFRWYFDHLNLPEGSRVLELGCGPAGLWLSQIEHVPGSWKMVLTDLSAGMVSEARRKLSARQGQYRFAVVDAEHIPFADGSFDAVIANHMLYHVPDRTRAIQEVRRVLCNGGRLFAATNGAGHLTRMDAWMERLRPDAYNNTPFSHTAFNLENGGEQLAASFTQVSMQRYPDGLMVTEVGPLLDYIFSIFGPYRAAIPTERVAELRETLEREIREKRAIAITKDAGMFIAA